MDKNLRKIPIRLVTVFFLCLLCNVFSVLCLHASAVSFITKNVVLFSVIACFAFTAVAVCSVPWIVLQRETYIKGVFTALFFAGFCLIFCYVLQISGFFVVVKDEKSLQNYLARTGVWMPVTYIVLQYLQVVILPIPGIVSTAAGVALFGAFFTTIYSLIGIILGSLTAFFIGRKYGATAVSWLIGKETLKTWQKKLRGKDNFFLACAFLLPLFPDDILCFVAGLSTMSASFFTVLICVSRFLAITATCYSFRFIPFDTWWGLTIWSVIALLVIAAFIIMYKKFDEIQAWVENRFGKRRRKK